MKKLILLMSVIVLSGLLEMRAEGTNDIKIPKYGQDSIKCLENISVYSVFARKKMYEMAYPSWQYVFDSCPAASKNTYIYGAKIQKYFIDKETEKEKKKLLVDSLMMIYNRRIEYFGEAGRVKGLQGSDLLRYDSERAEEAYALLRESFNLLGKQSGLPILHNLMNASLRQYFNKKVAAEEFVLNYFEVVNVLEYKGLNKPNDKIDKVRNSVHQIFAKSGIKDEKLFDSVLGDKIKKDENDKAKLIAIISIYENIKHSNSKILLDVSVTYYDQNPIPKLAYDIARMYLASGNYNKATAYYLKSVKDENDDKQKSKYYYELASVTFAYLNNSQLGRTYAMKAIEKDPGWGKPYILIGKIYASYANKYGEKEFDHQTVYWVAVDKFVKAKTVDKNVLEEADELMKRYKLHFPGEEEIFFEGHPIGSVYKINDWINEETIVRSR